MKKDWKWLILDCLRDENLVADDISDVIKTCNTYLEQTNSTGTALESYLTKFLIISITSKFEEDIKGILLARICSCNDSQLTKYIDEKFLSYKHLKLPDIRGEILAKFDISLKTKFNKKIKGEPETNYNNIVENRRNAAHGGSVQLTFQDTVIAYGEAQKVIDALEDTLANNL